MSDLDTRIYDAYPCPTCEAGFGERCRTRKTRKPAMYPHAARWDAAEEGGLIEEWRREKGIVPA